MTAISKPFHFSRFEADIQQKLNVNLDEFINYLNDRNSGTAAWDNVVSTYQLGNKNIIINPTFSVNQRLLTSVADDTYHLDRWYSLTQSGNVTIAQQSDQEDGQPTNLRMTQPDVAAKRLGVAQIVESINVRHLRGKSVCLSARIRCSSSQAIRYAIIEHTGTADTVTSDIVDTWTSTDYTSGAGKFFISGITITGVGSTTPSANTWTSISLTGSLTSSANNLIVVFWSEGTLAQNATFDVGKVQTEPGAVSTAFDCLSIASTMDLCQRYYEKSWNTNTAPGTTWTAGSEGEAMSGPTLGADHGMTVFFKTTKRATPSFLIYDSAGTSSRISYFNVGWTNGGLILISYADERKLYVQQNGSSYAINFKWTAASEL